uniref:Uncharacterized protein n=1 Tax=Arundo donax TaxID=35708 RepID=A0A0A9GPB1_ARUDO
MALAMEAPSVAAYLPP